MVYLNDGTPEDPDWSEPIDLGFGGINNPCLNDLDGDGSTDIIEEFKYQLHADAQEQAEWERPTYWRISALPLSLLDIDGDGDQDVVMIESNLNIALKSRQQAIKRNIN